jgi:UDP-3-O-[3-hydroxymyristoyl] glucosamine N-acyltransferase
MELSFTAADIAQIVQPRELRGSTSQMIRRISALSSARGGDLSFLGNPKYKPDVAKTEASAVLVPADYDGPPKVDQLYFLVENPSVALARLCARIEQLLWPKPVAGIHPTAVIAPDATVPASATVGPLCVIESGAVIGERTHLQAQVFIGRGAQVGADCWLMPGVQVSAQCIVKNRVRLQPGVILGSDGFGYEFVGGRHEKLPQVGRVVVDDDVEIGANTTVDRARFSETAIGEGTKIDNLVQIAHNVVIGKHCIVCAQAGISGSTRLEDFVIIGGQAGLAGHLTLGRGAKIDAQTGVNRDIEPGAFMKGTPCVPYMLEQRINVLRQRLPELFRRVDEIEAQLENPSAAS